MPLPMIDTGYKPDGALGALYQGYNAGAAEQEQRNQMIASSLENIKNTMANYKQQQMMPNELAVSDLQGGQARQQSTPEMLAAFMRGKQGEYGQQEAAGKLKMGTVESDILAGNSKNKGSVFDQQSSDFLKGADMFLASGNNPFALAQSGVPPELIQQYTQLHKTGQLGTVVKQMKKRLADSIASRSKMAEARAADEGNITVAGMNIKAQKDLEQMRIDAGKYKKADSISWVNSLIKNGNYERASVALGMLAFQADTPEEKQKYIEEAAKYEQMAKEKAAAGRVNPATIDTASVSGLPGQQQTPSRQNPVAAGTKDNPIKLD